ncbi:MAG: hypothetical protein ACE5EO_10205 [Candidatus Krumholzibacteriia bacterium]
MAGENFRALIEEWVGSNVTVVNPESYKLTALGKGLTFQTYVAKLDRVGADYVTLSFSSVKQESRTSVEQVIPLEMIKRISTWGDEKLIHL